MAEQPSVEELLLVFFSRGKSSVGKGREFVQRSSLEEEDRDAEVTRASYDARLDAIVTSGMPERTRLNRLAGIQQPTLVANRDNDTS
jgi:predicted alpha/beta-hydrolase family hydrolase